MIILDLPKKVGESFIGFIQTLGRMCLFMIQTLAVLFTPPFYWRILLKQMLEVGYYSLPVVGLTAVFTGAVLALQSYTGLARFHAEDAIAAIVVLSITRELGPVLAGLMLAGRLSAAIAAEVGTMKVTEQIDALYTLNTDPIRYLVVPRVLAGIIMLPCLVIIADIIGVFGGYLIGVYKLGFNPSMYLRKTFEFLEIQDVMSGLIKASTFGFIVCLVGCYYGYYSKGGAQGVGSATTSAVVSSSILILLFNYIITGLLFTQ
ncbi:putative ABC transporter permease protein RT0041 [Alphaproteobacteria bacterium]